MKHLWKPELFVSALLAAALSPAGANAQAQAQTPVRTYAGYAADVPFKFTVGHRKFNAGNYKFVVLGPGLLAFLNTKTREVVHLITRDTPAATIPESTRLVFTVPKKGYSSLTSVLLEGHAQGLEIIGEEIAIPQNPQPSVESLMPGDFFAQPGLRHVAPRRWDRP